MGFTLLTPFSLRISPVFLEHATLRWYREPVQGTDWRLAYRPSTLGKGAAVAIIVVDQGVTLLLKQERLPLTKRPTTPSWRVIRGSFDLVIVDTAPVHCLGRRGRATV